MAESRSKINKVYIVGTLVEVDTKIGTTAKDNREYISGKIVVKTISNGVESLIDIKLFSFAKKNNGEDNRVFASYKKLEGMLNKRVKVSGDLREDAMVRPDGTIIKFNTINLNFINEAKQDDVDCATFEYSGFVVKQIYERKNKDEETIGYRIEVAQANYNDSNIQIIKFDIDKNDMAIIQAIESNYLAGETISFSGVITYKHRIETKTEEVAFGDPITKTFTTSEKVFRITGGKDVFPEDNPGKYTTSEIKDFIEAYKKADAERLEKSKTSSDEASESAPQNSISKMTRTTSLI